MIKNLSLKFVLVFLVLVVSVFITSTCYANVSALSKVVDVPFSLDDVYNEVSSLGLNKDNSVFLVVTSNDTTYDGSTIWVFSTSTGLSYIKEGWENHTSAKSFNELDEEIYCDYYRFTHSLSDGFGHSSMNLTLDNKKVFSAVGSTVVGQQKGIGDITTATLKKYNGDVIYSPNDLKVNFDYSLLGFKRGQVELSITNLDPAFRMYGYVNITNNFKLGDVLDTNLILSDIRLLTLSSDNSDLNCFLYEGEELVYYIVDSNNIIVDIGYVSEMAKGDFLYGFNVYNGVDFVFLRDGQVYWDSNLIFRYSLGNSEELIKNDVVSMGESSLIVTDKALASATYNGFVYDSSNNLVASSSVYNTNDLSSISIETQTYYAETTAGWNKSCYTLSHFTLSGTNKDGTSIDFSNYYAKWSVPTWLILDGIEVNGEKYSKRSGVFKGFSSTGYSGVIRLTIYELLKNHTANFDIKLEIFDSDDNLVLTHNINSDDIVQRQIASEENNVDKGEYDILDNPDFTGGNNNSSTNGSINIDNINDWTADDYANLLSTDNFVWEFFKAILGNLPWWIETPLTILIFGVVIISLIRFVRGA